MVVTVIPDNYYFGALTFVGRVFEGGRVLINPILPAIGAIEKSILDRACEVAPDSTAELLKEQMAYINVQKRVSGLKEVLYLRLGLTLSYKSNIAPSLPIDSGKVRLFRFKLLFEKCEPVHGSCYALNRSLYSMTYNESYSLFKSQRVAGIEIKNGALMHSE